MTGSHDKEHRVRVRAYHLWETEGRPDGREAEFWHRAAELDHLESTAGQDAPPPPQPTPERVAVSTAAKKPRAKAPPAPRAKQPVKEAVTAKAPPPKRAGAPTPGEPKPDLSAGPRAKARVAEHP